VISRVGEEAFQSDSKAQILNEIEDGNKVPSSTPVNRIIHDLVPQPYPIVRPASEPSAQYQSSNTNSFT